MTELKPTFSGNLKDISFPKLLCEIYLMRTSGSLRIIRGKAKKEVLISHGIPTKVTSNLLQEVLGRYLVKIGRISEEKYQQTLDIAFKLKHLHGDIMVSNGLITKDELNKYLKGQSYLKLLNLFKWVDGDYAFYKHDSISLKGDFDDTPLPDLIYRGIKSGYSLDRLMTELEPYKDYYLAPSTIKTNSTKIKNLSEQEKWLIDIVDGTRTINEIIELSPLEFIESYQLTYSSIVLNNLEVREKPITSTVVSDQTIALDELTSKTIKSYHEMTTKNYFEVLGVNQSDSPLDIKKAYIKLAKEYHPDSYPSNVLPVVEKTLNKIFSTINKAYRVLSDGKMREEYIKSLFAPVQTESIDEINNIMNAEVQFQKGKILLKKRDLKGAKNAMEWAVKLSPEEGEYLAYYGWLTFLNTEDKRGQDAVTAVKYLKKAAVLNPSTEFPHLFLGSIYKIQNLKDVAILHFKKALEINPENIEIKKEIKLLTEMRPKQEKGGIFGIKKK